MSTDNRQRQGAKKLKEQERKNWHTMSVGQVAEEWATDPDSGLDPGTAKKRQSEYGPNELNPPEPVDWYEVLVDQFESVVVLLLLAAAIAAFAMGEMLEGGSIIVIILLNAGIGFITEYRANRAMEALQKLGAGEATVIRDGERKTINGADLVPGDMIVLQEGETVPADARLVESAELQVEEASLTGESEPVRKTTDTLDDEDLPLADRKDMVYKSTHVNTGNGRAIVVNTGMGTEIGRVSELVSGVEEEDTPLEERLDTMGKRLIVFCLGVAVIVFLAGLLRDTDPGLMLRTAIALAVAAVPEGLPAVATITLAVGMKRMARRNALIRRLPAVETLGSATCVCSDKTGTLTRGEMTMERIALAGRDLEVSGDGYEPEGEFREADQAIDPTEDRRLRSLLLVSVLCNNATVEHDEEEGWSISGDTTEGALTVAAAKAGYDAEETRSQFQEVHEFAFTSDVMMMATVNEGLSEDFTPGDGMMLCVKGAPDVVLERCTQVLDADGVHELSQEGREQWKQDNQDLAGQGLRMLGMACRPVDSVPEDAEDAYSDLVWLGLTGIVDPPRDEVRQTVDMLNEAGIKTVMITGDQPATASRIAAELHIAPEGARVLTGRDLAKQEPGELADHLDEVEVFARVSPEQKVDICTALQEDGEIVAMLGDGVNDAVALKKADIGVAMGIKGTDVAKETADMVLLDDRFATVGAAMEQGRIIYSNIQKFVHYLFSCNLSRILLMLVASLFAGVLGTALPLLPLQILWLNMITDVFPALALAVEPGEKGIMKRPPRSPEASLVGRQTIMSILGFAALLTLATALCLFIGKQMHGAPGNKAGLAHAAGTTTAQEADANATAQNAGTPEDEADNGHGTRGMDPHKAQTMAFMCLALAEILHVFNSRKSGRPMRGMQWFTNKWVLAAIVWSVFLQLLAVYAPGLKTVLATAPLGLLDWAIVLGCASIPLVVGQTYRRIRVAI